MIAPFETFTPQGLVEALAQLDLPAYRATQIEQWVYEKAVTSYQNMTNLSKSLREVLEQELPLNIPVIVDKHVSQDGSRKYLLQFADGSCVETVGIPSRDNDSHGNPRRLTVCFSTQVGCGMSCAFCATGTQGFTRNLLPGEMAQQICTVQRDFNMRVTNAVAMGQGEPFLNYKHLAGALQLLNSTHGVNIGARHITVSTCGIPRGIRAFAAEPQQFTLAVSLHAADQQTRDQLMPGCTRFPLSQLHIALESYWSICHRRVSLEYLMIDHINDSPKHLDTLVAFCKGLHVHINLLQLNYVDGSTWHPSSKRTLEAWQRRLTAAGIETSIRDSRGSDIAAACGQLKNERVSAIL